MVIMPTILIIDSNQMFRQALTNMICRYFPELTVEEAQTADEGLQKAIQDKPQLVVTDLHLNGDKCFNMIRQIALQQPEARIAVLTDKDEEEYRQAALGQGADYFISKSGPNGQKILSIIKMRLSGA